MRKPQREYIGNIILSKNNVAETKEEQLENLREDRFLTKILGAFALGTALIMTINTLRTGQDVANPAFIADAVAFSGMFAMVEAAPRRIASLTQEIELQETAELQELAA